MPSPRKQGMAKPDDVASNVDTGYETGSVASASSSSQTAKVRHISYAFVDEVKIDYNESSNECFYEFHCCC